MDFFINRIPYAAPCGMGATVWNPDLQQTSLSVTCKVVRLFCSEGLKRCFEGFVLPRNSLIPILPQVSLGAIHSAL